jgi:hypothetical protein
MRRTNLGGMAEIASDSSALLPSPARHADDLSAGPCGYAREIRRFL